MSQIFVRLYSVPLALFYNSITYTTSWDTNSFSSIQEIPRFLRDQECSIPRSRSKPFVIILSQINPAYTIWTYLFNNKFNTLRTGDADLRFYITTVQDGWRKSAFLTRVYFPCTIHLIMQYMEPVSEWSCWRMFIETWPHSEFNPRNMHLNNLKAPSSMC